MDVNWLLFRNCANKINNVLLLKFFIGSCYYLRYCTSVIANEAFSYFDEGTLCEFNITSERNGPSRTLESPSYPKQYDQNLRCVYNFVSKGTERVQIIFTDFDLYHPDNGKNETCRGEHDHLTAYVELNGRMSEIKTFCGTKKPPPLMSSKNQLTLEFITQTALNPYTTVHKGFQLTYKFITDFGIHEGVKDPKHVCGFLFNSTNANNGSIYSPNHPGYYPRNIDCHYTFHGKPDEKVRIYFTYFDVEGEPPCNNDSKSDYLEFSNYNTLDLKMMRYCGYMSLPQTGMESERDFFNVTFHSNSVFDRTGFFGYYQFVKQEPNAALKTVKNARTSSPNSAARCHGILSSMILMKMVLCIIIRAL